MNKYERAYKRIEEMLQRPIPDLKMMDTFRLKAGGFMDLVCEVLHAAPGRVPRCSHWRTTTR